jgi:hypothetical protein
MGSVSTPYVLTRCSFCDEASEIPGAYIYVQAGTSAGTGWIQVVADPTTFVVGTDNIDVYQFSGSGTYTAGTGLTLTGNEYSINTSVTADLSTAQTLTNKTITGAFTGNLTGNADTATNGVVTTGTYSNPSWITGLEWSKISSTPTTISGYGITNAVATDLANTITAPSSGIVPLTVSIPNGSTSNIASFTQAGSTYAANINQFGQLITAFGVISGTTSGFSNTRSSFAANGASNVVIGVRGASSQTADLQQWLNSSSTVLTKIDATGNITAPSLTLSSTALATTSGGTGLSSYAAGDIIYSSATNTLAKLAKGTDGQILTLASGVPSWAAAPITLPTQTDNAGKYLTTDGSTASWASLVVPITTGTATITGNTATTIDTNALSGFTSIEYMVSLKQGSKIRTSKVIVQTDGTSVDMTEFAITETGGTIAGIVISAAVSSTNAVLQVTATDAATTNVTVKFSEIKL